MTTTAGALATHLVDVVERELTALAGDGGPLPGFELPRLLMGHEVGPDVRADLLFTLGLVHECGRETVAGVPVTEAISGLLAGVHGKRTHTFYSYRVAETVGRFGSFTDNPLLAPLSDEQRAQVATAADSTEWIAALDEGLVPRNYAAVLARCEHARRRLGLLDEESALEDLLARVRSMLGAHLDDSPATTGRYDIYTVDIHLFCEPMAGELGEPWQRGARLALDLVDRVAARDGTAVPWGRSSGVLAICHTIELGGLVAGHDLVEDRHRWMARAAVAAAGIGDWFRDGWIVAHQHRSSDPYRGLDRRLQMTLDCLGKLVDTARNLFVVADVDIDVDRSALLPPRDEVVWLDRGRNAGVWSFRSPGTAFVLPLVGGSTTDYLPAPRNPGLFEVPVGGPLATGTPMVLHRGRRYASGGPPVSAEHGDGRLTARYEGFRQLGGLELDGEAETYAGSRDATWRVEGRSLVVEEDLAFDQPPHALALQVAETVDRPLRVRFECDGDHTTATIDVSGIPEYRSWWGELPRLHQVDVRPARAVQLRWTVTPVLRVVSTAAGHHYNDALYGPLADRVRVDRLPYSAASNPSALADLAAVTDQLHVHWPEWLAVESLEQQRQLIDGLRDGGLRIVWTQHNLLAHTKDPATVGLYEAWAAAADLVFHHSRWGMERALATYRYGDHTRHVVIPHGHFGAAPVDVPAPAGAGGPAVRAAVEQELGLRRGVLRLGIFGAPRAEKDLELAMRAVSRLTRDDVELLVLSLGGNEHVPDDPRVVALPYEMVPRDVYDRRLRAVDALLMPFDPDGDMLTTGTIGDAIGFGLPSVASSWPFLTEALGTAAITYGRTEDELVACLESLDRAALDAAAAAAVALRPTHDWATVAEQVYVELDLLGSTHH